MSLNELAVDLTCDPAEFEPAVTPPRPKMSNVMPGTLFPEEPTAEKKPRTPRPRFQVHGGMLRMSKVMGAHGRPVHVAVKDALRKNKGYGESSHPDIQGPPLKLLLDLVLCGHSLGAGVAALLGLVCLCYSDYLLRTEHSSDLGRPKNVPHRALERPPAESTRLGLLHRKSMYCGSSPFRPICPPDRVLRLLSRHRLTALTRLDPRPDPRSDVALRRARQRRRLRRGDQACAQVQGRLRHRGRPGMGEPSPTCEVMCRR